MNYLASLHNKDLAFLFIRIALALVFIYHGFAKVSDLSAAAGMFEQMGFMPMWAYVVGFVEFFGGILMLLGIRVREVGALFAIIMVVAIYAIHLPNGFNFMNNGYEFQLTLLLASLAAVFGGAGKYAVWKSKDCDNCKDGVCKC